MIDRATIPWLAEPWSQGWQSPDPMVDRATSCGRQCDAASILTICNYAKHECAWTGQGIRTNDSHCGRDIKAFSLMELCLWLYKRETVWVWIGWETVRIFSFGSLWAEVSSAKTGRTTWLFRNFHGAVKKGLRGPWFLYMPRLMLPSVESLFHVQIKH